MVAEGEVVEGRWWKGRREEYQSGGSRGPGRMDGHASYVLTLLTFCFGC